MSCNSTIHFTKNYLTWANYQTRAIRLELLNITHFHTKIDFRVTAHMNSKTLGFTVPSTHQFIGSLCEPEFHGHFRPHTNQYMIYFTIFTTNNPNSPCTVTDGINGFPNFLTIQFQALGRIKRPLTVSFNSNINKVLKKRVKPK